jgi:hypothetical protein
MRLAVVIAYEWGSLPPLSTPDAARIGRRWTPTSRSKSQSPPFPVRFWQTFAVTPTNEVQIAALAPAQSQPPTGPSQPPGGTSQPPAEITSSQPEVGGRQGPDPTRYGDWELRGRCIDF